MPTLPPASSQAIEAAVRSATGGDASFAEPVKNAILSRVPYRVPNQTYRTLFSGLGASSPTDDASLSLPSAGWIAQPECNPIFIAHSLISAIWGIRETLPKDSISASTWEVMYKAANELRATHSTNKRPSDEATVGSLSKRPRPEDPPTKTPANKTTTGTEKPASSSDDALVPTSTSSMEDALLELAEQADGLDDEDESEGPTPPTSQSPAHGRPIRRSGHAPTPPVIQTTVTNNHRRRAARRKVQRQAPSRQIGLARPPASASAREVSAYNSITAADEPDLAWVLARTTHHPDGVCSLFDGCEEPYMLATTMLKNARLVGTQDTWSQVRSFIRAWRCAGAPFPTRSTLQDSTVSSQLAHSSDPAGSAEDTLPFVQQAWTAIGSYEQSLEIVHMQYRWAMAYLVQAYNQRIEVHRAVKSGAEAPALQTLQTLAKKDLLARVTSSPSKEQRLALTDRLRRGARWHSATQRLGWGVLCLLPSEGISNIWVERRLRVGEWEVWLDLVKHVNQEACTASRQFEHSLGITVGDSGSIPSKSLLIEIGLDLPSSLVEEVEDSDGSGRGDDGDSTRSPPSDGGHQATRRSSRAAAPDVATKPPKGTRQLSLLELFKQVD